MEGDGLLRGRWLPDKRLDDVLRGFNKITNKFYRNVEDESHVRVEVPWRGEILIIKLAYNDEAEKEGIMTKLREADFDRYEIIIIPDW